MDRQKLYNETKQKLIEQGCRSIAKTEESDFSSGVVCMYRGQNDTKCALGHLIPDELYDPVIEGSSPIIEAHSLSESTNPWLRIHEHLCVDGHQDLYFLRDLQRVHDNCSNWSEFMPRMQSFARQYKLSP